MADARVSTGGTIDGSNQGDLRGILNAINQTSGQTHTIKFNLSTPGDNVIQLAGILPIVNLFNANNITIDGTNLGTAGEIVLGGANTYRGLFVKQGNVAIQNMGIQRMKALGGDGGAINFAGAGGGGLGAGGALFVDSDAIVTLSNANLAGNNATGGNGAAGISAQFTGGGSGGGGLGGSGGSNVNIGGSGGGGIGSDGGLVGGVDMAVSGSGGGGISPATTGTGGSCLDFSIAGSGGGGNYGIGASGATSYQNAGTASSANDNYGGGGGGGGGGLGMRASSSGAGIGGVGGGDATNANGGGGGGGGNVDHGGSPGDGARLDKPGNGGSGGNGGGGGGGGFGAGSSMVGGDGGDGGIGGGGGGGGAYGDLNGTGGKGGAGGYGGGGGGGGAGPLGEGDGGIGGFGGGGGGGGSGGGGISGSFTAGNGGASSFGGGGGGGGSDYSSSSESIGGNGGAGGFGAGGGGAGTAAKPGSPGIGGIGGCSGLGVSGGGGAAFGGAVFVNTGGTLIVNGSLTTSGNTVAGGTGPSADVGAAFGEDFFLRGATNLTFNPPVGDIITIEKSIGDSSPNTVGSGHSYTAGNEPGASVSVNGAGTVSLQERSTYSGGTTISAGTLEVSTAGAMGSGTVLINGGVLSVTNSITEDPYAFVLGASNGTIAVAAGETYKLSSDSTISGSGILDKKGSGTLTINALNAQAGGYQILEGALSFNTSGANAILSAPISGPGALEKVGAGMLSLTGINPHAGITKVEQGILAINGQLNSSTVTVAPGATLKGKGKVSGAVTVQGTLSPGASIGTLTVASVNFASGSTFAVEIDPTTSSRLDVTGTATVEGPTTILVTENTGNYVPGTTYKILTAGSIAGPGSFTVQSISPNFTFDLLSFPNEIQLRLALSAVGISIPTSSLSGNRLILAKTLNSLADYAPLAPVLKALHALPEKDLVEALDAISPARNAFAAFAAQTTAFQFSDLLVSRFANRRFLMTAQKKCGEPWKMAPFAFCKKTGPRFNGWASGFGQFSHEKEQNQTPSFDMISGGALVGFDAGLYEQLLVGGSFGYGRIQVQQDNHLGKANLNDYVASGYASLLLSDLFYLNAAVWGGYQEIKTKREISFLRFTATANGETHSFQVMPHLDFGVRFTKNQISVEPFARFDWALNFGKGFKEKEAGVLNLHQEEQTSSMLRSEVGVSSLQTWELTTEKRTGLIAIRETLSYVNKTPFQTGRVRAEIAGAPGGSFMVETLTAAQNLIAPSLEFYYKSEQGIFFSLNYEGEFGDRYVVNTGFFKIGKEF